MAIVVRLAEPADAMLIAQLSRQTFYETFALQNSSENMNKFMDLQFASETLIKEVGAEGNTFLLAYEAEEPVGYARVRESKAPEALGSIPSLEIARIYAVTQTIGKGVGKSLMQKCIEIAKEKKKGIIWLGVWEKNQRAIDFYTKWGFEKFGEHPFLLGDDVQTDWLMKKTL
jgi:ribosomal protein S18 acetylase RimI-like enzyme